MLKTATSAFVEALCEAVETMAFMVAIPPEEELPPPTQGVLVRMSFSGPVSATVELLAGTDFAQMLTANVMGLDPTDEDAVTQYRDGFKELLNTTCGVLLPMLARTPEDVFDLTVPEAQDFDGQEFWDTYVAHDETAVVDVDGVLVAARMIEKE